MKALTFLAVLLGLGAIGASVFAKVETYGNFQYMANELATNGPRTEFDVPLLAEYAQTLTRLHLVAWIAGGLALILGVLAYTKTREARIKTPLPILAILLGLAGAGLAILSTPPWI